MRDLTRWLEQPSTESGINLYDGARWTRSSYAEFAGQVLGAAERLRQEGVGRRDRVALALPSGGGFARYFFGAMALGAVPAPIAPPGYQGRGDYGDFALSRLSALEPSCVVTEQTTMRMLAGRRTATGTLPRYIDAADPLPVGGPHLLQPFAPDDLALIQFTSGSSSAPRGVTLTSAAIQAQVDIIEEISGGFNREHEAFSSWLPLHHDMGLIGLFVTPVVHNGELWLMRPEHFVRRPIDWLATFGRHGARHSATPNFALGQLARRTRPEQLEGMDFSRFETLIIGSDRVNFPLVDAVYRLLAPFGMRAGTFSPAYGMAEATLAVTSTRPAAPPTALVLETVEFSSGAAVKVTGEYEIGGCHPTADGTPADGPGPVGGSGPVTGDSVDNHTVMSCGHEPAGVQVLVLDESGTPVPDGHVGELLVRSPALSHGYLNEPPENARFSHGGFRTGDLGFRRDGQIYVLGRAGDSVKVNGRFVTAEDVELAAERALNLPPDRIAVVLRDTAGAPVVLLAVQDRIDQFDPELIADVVSSFGLDPLRLAVLWLPRKAVPRTTSGKPRRGELWHQLRTGTVVGQTMHVGADFPVQLGGAASLRTELGGKGYHLTLMQAEHLPVPPFTVFGSGELDSALTDAAPVDPAAIRTRLAGLTAAAVGTFDAAEATIGLAVRSSHQRSMPGMLDTLLGIGLTPESVGPLAERLGSEQAAWDTLLLQARHLCRHVAGASPEQLRRAEAGLGSGPDRWARLTALFAELTGRSYPTDPVEQVQAAIVAVRASWNSARARDYRRANQIPENPGPAVVVQAMAYGAAAGVSGSGVVFSHNPLNGDPGLFGEYLPAATGEELVSGTRTPQPVRLLRDRSPDVYGQLSDKVGQLYRTLRAMVDVEFVVENGRLWLVQVRPATAGPHVLNRVCVQAWQEQLLSPVEALLRLDTDALFRALPATAQPGADDRLLAVGLPACSGVARGPVVTGLDAALGYDPGQAVLLRPTTEPADFAGMMQSAAVLTLEGGNTSHAAVVARELGVPAVVGMTIVDSDWADLVAAALADPDAALTGSVSDGPALPEVTVCGTSGQVWAGWVAANSEAAPPRPDALLAAAVPAEVPLLAPGSAVPADLTCPDITRLPPDTAGQVVATGDVSTAEAWAVKGGRVVFLLDADPAGGPVLPDCDLIAVVLGSEQQRERLRWSLAQRTARGFAPDAA